MPLFSIIIPIYKVEEFIIPCLQSVVDQQIDDIELILINDATPDASYSLAKSFFENNKVHFPIKWIEHNSNEGLSKARNSGIQNATGDYLLFIDSDDWLCSRALTEFANIINNNPQIDMIVGDYESNGVHSNRLNIEQGVYYDPAYIFDTFCIGKWYEMAWNKVIRREFIEKHQLLFRPQLLHEDFLWSFQVAFALDSVYILKIPTYHYLIRGESSISGNVQEKNMLHRILICNTIQEILKLNSDLIKQRSIKKLLVRFRWGMLTDVVKFKLPNYLIKRAIQETKISDLNMLSLRYRLQYMICNLPPKILLPILNRLNQ